MFDLFKKKAMQYKNIQAEQFKAIIDENPDTVVLDVRTPGEVKQGKIPGATAIDIMHPQFLEKIEKLDKDKTYLVYCRSGSRSAQACQYMGNKGFSDLNNLSGGISRWPYETE